MKFKLAGLSSLELMVIGVDSPVRPTVAHESPRVSHGRAGAGASSAGHVRRVKQEQLDAVFNDAPSFLQDCKTPLCQSRRHQSCAASRLAAPSAALRWRY